MWNVYNANGKLLLRLERGFFNQPWGVALAPANFGKFSNMILVGNTGSGLIGAYKLQAIFPEFPQNWRAGDRDPRTLGA